MYAEGGAPLRAHASLVEACLARAWPGNVRELCAEIQTAAQEARSAGSSWVQARHLAPGAGQPFATAPEGAFATAPALEPPRAAATASEPAAAAAAARIPAPAQASQKWAGKASTARRPAQLPADEIIEQALRREEGNVTRAARALGVHRNQLRRWLARNEADGDPRAND
ncbi:helix-turn-helix domain-containing protein [Sorangium sp. So ce1128]